MKKHLLTAVLLFCLVCCLAIPALAADTYTVTLDPNGGTFDKTEVEALKSWDVYGLVNISVHPDGCIEVEANADLSLSKISSLITKNDGTALAYWQDVNDSQNHYESDGYVYDHQDVSLIALWETPITVTILPGEGSFSENIQWIGDRYQYNETDNSLQYNGFEDGPFNINNSWYFKAPSGKTFVGFVDQNGKIYDQNGDFLLYDKMVLTARYAGDVTVVFDANGGTFDETQIPYYAKISVDFDKVTCTRTEGIEFYLSQFTDALIAPQGKVFGGWKDNEGKTYDRSAIAKEGLVLSPVWLDPLYWVAHANGGTFDREITSRYPEVTLSPDATTITVAYAPGNSVQSQRYFDYLISPDGRIPVAWTDQYGFELSMRDDLDEEYYCYWAEPAFVTIDLNGGTVDDDAARYEEVTVVADHRSVRLSGGQGETRYLGSYSRYFSHSSGKCFAGVSDSDGRFYAKNRSIPILAGEVYTAVWKDPVTVTFQCGEKGSFEYDTGTSQTITTFEGDTVYLSSYSCEPKQNDLIFAGWEDEQGNRYEKDASYPVGMPQTLTAIYLTEDELPRLATPTDLQWHKDFTRKKDGDSYTYTYSECLGCMYWKCPENQGHYKIRLFDADSNIELERMDWWDAYGDEFSGNEFLEFWWRNGSGRYYFTVQVLGDGLYYRDSNVAKSDVWEYNAPRERLPQGVKPYWGSGEKADVAYWNMPNTSYAFGSSIEFYYAPAEGVIPQIIGSSYGEGLKSRQIWDSLIQRYGPGYYYARVRYISYDIAHVLPGRLSAPSEPYILNPKPVQNKLAEIIDGLSETPSAQEVIDAVKSSIASESKKEELRTALLADNGTADGVLDTVSKLEDMTGIDLDIKIDDELFTADSVSVVGAKLNAAADADAVSLNISKPEQDRYISETLLPTTQYQNTVQFSMDLANSSKDQDGKLAVPIKIKMPVPGNINPDYLVILHEHHDGTLETVLWPDYTITQENGCSYVSFVVTDFSTFAFAQSNVSIRESDGKLCAETTSDANLMLALYDKNGKMLSCNNGTDSVSAAMTEKVASAKVFLIGKDGTFTPALPSIEWKRS